MTTYTIACIISGLALVAFLCTGSLALYTVYQGIYKYLPIHTTLMVIQFSLIWFLNNEYGP